MRSTTSSTIALLVLGATAVVNGLDTLVSKRHQKRFIDEAGNYVRASLLVPAPCCDLECSIWTDSMAKTERHDTPH